MGTRNKCGQALVEFMIGLVGILVLVLGLSYAAVLVGDDCQAILNARMDVAEDLIASSSSPVDSVYDPTDIYGVLDQNINQNSDGRYEDFLADYPQSEREDGFSFLRGGGDPLTEMMGSEKTITLPVTSPLMQTIFNRSSIRLQHGVWMPPWDDLL